MGHNEGSAMKFWQTLAFFFSLLSIAIASDETDTKVNEDEAVVVLTTDNFNQFLNDNPITLVEFYAPWCGYCKKLAPEYESAARTLREAKGVPLAKVDATVETELATKFAVRGYPTLKLFRNGTPEDYTGPRDAEGIVRWIGSMTGPAVLVIETQEEVGENIKNTIGFVGKFKSKDSPFYIAFEDLADRNRAFGTYVALIDETIEETVSAIHPGEEPIFTTSYTDEALDKWLEQTRFPLFGPINADNYSAYTGRLHELVWFAGTADQYKEAGTHIREAAKSFTEDFAFVWLDSEKFGSHATDTLGVPQFPGMVIQTKAGRYIYPKSTFDRSNDLIQFAKDVLGGKIEKSLKSEPIPETNDDAVKVVVGKNFEEMVMQKDKDVMLEVYAPWCGHCKKLEPIYKEFAEKVAHVSHILVAKMDGAANESPLQQFSWGGFPTIFFVPAGSTEPMDYDGARTVDGLLEFVQKHSTQKVVIEVSKEEL